MSEEGREFAIYHARYDKFKDKGVSAWAILAKDGQLPEWELVRAAAKKMCWNCDVFIMQNEAICRTCPGVELIKALMASCRKDEKDE
jgi:hypothetical protein